MDMDVLLSFEWGAMAPEFIILGVATILSLLDLFMPKSIDRKILGWIGVAGIAAAIVTLLGMVDEPVVSILADTFRLDAFGKAFKLLLLAGSALVLMLAISYKKKDGMEEAHGEFYYLFLTALLGAMFMASSGDLITLFVGLELLSISSYILAGIRKHHLQSNESAMKYVINGGISTAITLFGMSYVYGLTGTTNLKGMTSALATLSDPQHVYLLSLAFLMIFVGLSFKLAAAPFHMWAPDVYQGAPTPVTAFLSVVSKTAGFVLVIRVLLSVFGITPAEGPGTMPILLKMQDYIAFIAAATMVIGNVIALRQSNIKRLFAYSSIAHAGYVLVAFASMSFFMFDAIWFYLAAYLFMNIGAFAIIQLIEEKTGSGEISAYAGLYRRAPLLAVAFGVLIISLAGFPGTAGFIGKLNIFMGAFVENEAHYVLGSVMIATTVVSYFYYFGIMVQMFFRPSASDEKIKAPATILVVLGICLIATVLLGVAPNVGLDFIHEHFNQFQDFLG
ncbi:MULTISPECIES: NADH-quinone oxidoreductase subunit NuoN [unclassified Bacillus (in: firmicutes)]|uniref:NADH-quinone oxidoreductase subunit NuoN n=1 Tax=unclassified Bacillus (in: firmicutes) TaxID=185979 RepID=UPI0008E9A869|nr:MULTISPECIES: NADH-quinone oxidoreductase subunit NuoN [unclassified Bacillus (in: firmicutes)]SFB04042.1 NADH dehydrogenase subunit N [Bacillus sp. UNCCL13]SFQ88610.1 NADH dehydrogenase subunit N [Bacillus sp. cl95]